MFKKEGLVRDVIEASVLGLILVAFAYIMVEMFVFIATGEPSTRQGLRRLWNGFRYCPLINQTEGVPTGQLCRETLLRHEVQMGLKPVEAISDEAITLLRANNPY